MKSQKRPLSSMESGYLSGFLSNRRKMARQMPPSNTIQNNIITQSDKLKQMLPCIRRYEALSKMPPNEFLRMLLTSRGYPSAPIDFEAIKSARTSPTEKQIRDYDHKFVLAVRSSDVETVKSLHAEGREMMACNKYGESILHIACRRGSLSLVSFLLSLSSTNPSHIDDYGRNALHDACWRSEACLEVTTLLLDRNLNLLRCPDVRGATPLQYVPQDQWAVWNMFLYMNKEKYWPVRQSTTPPPSLSSSSSLSPSVSPLAESDSSHTENGTPSCPQDQIVIAPPPALLSPSSHISPENTVTEEMYISGKYSPPQTLAESVTEEREKEEEKEDDMTVNV